MFNVSNHGEGYQLSAAVLIYTNPGNRHAFATKHEVQLIDGRPTVRPGSPFSEVDYRNLIKAMAPKEQPRMQWQDHRVLAKGLGKILWWEPPTKRSLFFRKSSHNAGTFDGKGLCPCPGLVFMATPRALYVYAFQGEQAPHQRTKLYQAPFFNVWSSGQVCVGNATLPGEELRGDPDAWERMFFGSHFTHPNFTQKDRLTKGVNPTEFWQQMVTQPIDVFPEGVLVEVNLSVEDLMEVDAEHKLHARTRAQGEF